MPSLTTMVAALLVFAGTGQLSRSGTAGRDDDAQIRVNGPVTIARGDTGSTVWVVNHDAAIDGGLREGLGVINGTARAGVGALVARGWSRRARLRPATVPAAVGA